MIEQSFCRLFLFPHLKKHLMKSKVQFLFLLCIFFFSNCQYQESAHKYDRVPLSGNRANVPLVTTKKLMPPSEKPNREGYDKITENDFQSSLDHPLSTFSIDVDNASYSNVRRFLTAGEQVPTDAVRIEELINYFSYQYPQAQGEAPFSSHAEVADCPWNDAHRLLKIGLQGRTIPQENIPASNIVFLLDVSGSMGNYNKLPLLKSAFRMLIKELRPIDKVAIVVYAGASGLVLPATSGDDKQTILRALDRLESGGSTAGASGIKLAYKVAHQNFIKRGNNRIILATDGDFNVGPSSDSELIRLVENQRESGVFLSVLGFGSGNLQDGMMEKISNHGNGNYAYIDNIKEAKKVLVEEMSGTLFTIAKDVKLQVEFNPAQVKEYRLIGYENRILAAEDFNDDKKDAGDLGAGHSVTALYEIIPTSSKSPSRAGTVDPLKYQQKSLVEEAYSKEMLTLKLRYKLPNASESKLLEYTAIDRGKTLEESSVDFQFAAAVATFGMLLRDSKHRGEANWELVNHLGRKGMGSDPFGYRREFLQLARIAGGGNPVEVVDDVLAPAH